MNKGFAFQLRITRLNEKKFMLSVYEPTPHNDWICVEDFGPFDKEGIAQAERLAHFVYDVRSVVIKDIPEYCTDLALQQYHEGVG